VVIVAALLAISSERAMGVTKMENQAAARQRAVYAAEGVAALLEVRLLNLAANNDLQGLDTDPNPNYGVQWFGDCLVRWRIEPVMARQDPTRPATDLSSAYTVNPVADTNILPPTGSYVNNHEFYTYRIATEAYQLANPTNLAGFNAANPSDLTATGLANPAAPWNNPQQRVCALQSQRVVQLKLNSLFKYAIFYAATGNTGDLEFWVGTSISVQGAVHSNGAIYIGGQGQQYLSGNYHNSASLGGNVSIGTNASRVTITGIDGLYRMRKGANVLAVRNPAHPLYSAAAVATPGFVPNPLAIPRDNAAIDDNVVMIGNANLNGDTPGTMQHAFNGNNFTSSNDSRSPTWVTGGPFGQFVRDDQKGATVVRTLSNIPELAGRPFEHQRIVGPGQLLYDQDGVAPFNNDFTIAPTAASLQLYYTAAPLAASPGLTTTMTTWPVSAENMLLYENTTTGDRDVHPSGTLPVIDANFTCSNLPAGTRLASGYYFNLAVNGDGSAAGVTGLVFRERYAQLAGFGRVPVRADAAYTSDALFRQAYANYIASQYQVLLGGLDITTDFVTQGIVNVTPATVTTSTTTPGAPAFIVAEETFVNMREATAMDYFYGPFTRDTSMPNVLPAPLNNAAYKVNVLTLNLRAIQDYLRTRPWSTWVASAPATEMARDHFNGLIYAHRTRRSLTYDPINFPQYVFNPNSILNTYEWGALTAANHPHQRREGNGPLESFHCAIRVANATDIDWKHNGAAAAPLGTSGLTIVTPNHCYMWGSYNTTTHVDAAGTPRITPSAVFADGVTALSNIWVDNAHATAPTGTTDGSATTYILSYVINNVPTDDINAVDEGSGAVANVVRFIENWGGRDYTFQGSLVVMNQMRYSYTTLGAGANAASPNMNTSFYSPPRRVLTFNSDLLSRAGQPPYTPFGVQIIRTVSTIIDLQ